MIHILGLRSKGMEDEVEMFLAKEEQFMSMDSFHTCLLYCQHGRPRSAIIVRTQQLISVLAISWELQMQKITEQL